jgi:hypothetical protein
LVARAASVVGVDAARHTAATGAAPTASGPAQVRDAVSAARGGMTALTSVTGFGGR